VPCGLERVRCPVILAQGTADLISSAQTQRYLLAIPGSTLVPLVGAGHAAQSDNPGRSSGCPFDNPAVGGAQHGGRRPRT
jgi:pimeloyl-ACP methyl ester carboxylesterase